MQNHKFSLDDRTNALQFIEKSLKNARISLDRWGFPAGAVVVRNGKIVGEGISIGNKLHDPTSHGELSAIRDACKNLGTSDLSDCTLYSSMEPCMMCLNAAMWSSIPNVVFACWKNRVSSDYYGGNYETSSVNSMFEHPIEVVQIPEMEESSVELVREWEKSWKV